MIGGNNAQSPMIQSQFSDIDFHPFRPWSWDMVLPVSFPAVLSPRVWGGEEEGAEEERTEEEGRIRKFLAGEKRSGMDLLSLDWRVFGIPPGRFGEASEASTGDL